MKKFLLVVLVSGLTSLSAFATDDKKAATAPPMDPKKAEMMKNWQEFATPAAAHKVLEGMAGRWKYTSKMWETEKGEPHQSTGMSNMKMVLGGRFLQQEFKGKAMGMPFEGMGMTGYNNMTKEYETLWLDNMTTGMMQGKGSYDEASQTLKDEGEYSCPMTKKKDQKYKSELKMIDKNNMLFTMWGPAMDDGDVIKTMEISYSRAK